jgi:hypothetical protein
MKGYGQYCPITLAAEVFAERWTPTLSAFAGIRLASGSDDWSPAV